MADQATIDRRFDRPTRVRANLAGLAHDALTLAELQVQLLTVDLRDARRGAGAALSQVLVGSVLALGCVPVLILAAAHLLIEIAEWPASGAYAAVAILAAVVAIILLRLGWQRTSQALATVQRSRTELVETLHWLKESLRPAERSDASFRD